MSPSVVAGDLVPGVSVGVFGTDIDWFIEFIINVKARFGNVTPPLE